MNRRNFINSSIAAGVLLGAKPALNAFEDESKSPASLTRLKPKALKQGDKVGVIAPATAVSDPEDIQKALETLKYFGFDYEFGKSLEKGSGYKTRTVKERIDDLHSMFENKSIKAIFCIRGGYGSMGILDQIDYELVKSNPKIFCGYSDITAMHLAINKFSGLTTFHGPMMLSGFTKYTEDNFRKVFFSTSPIGELKNPEGKKNFRDAYPITVFKSGTARGRLIGGNLSLITSLMGTKYEIETDGKLLFIEDVGEKPYQIDRMIQQLKLAKKFDKIGGLIIGKCEDCQSDGSQSSLWDRTQGEVYRDLLSDLKVPIAYGFMIGHTSDQLTLPLGIEAELNTDKKSINILESGVV